MEKTEEMQKAEEIKNISATELDEPNVHLPMEDAVYLRKERRATMIILIVMVLMALAIGIGTGMAVALGGA